MGVANSLRRLSRYTFKTAAVMFLSHLGPELGDGAGGSPPQGPPVSVDHHTHPGVTVSPEKQMTILSRTSHTFYEDMTVYNPPVVSAREVCAALHPNGELGRGGGRVQAGQQREADGGRALKGERRCGYNYIL